MSAVVMSKTGSGEDTLFDYGECGMVVQFFVAQASCPHFSQHCSRFAQPMHYGRGCVDVIAFFPRLMHGAQVYIGCGSA